MKVLLDTNFILYCLKKKIDIEEELKRINEDSLLEIIILSPIIKELEEFCSKKNKKLSDKEKTKIFLNMLKEKAIDAKIIDAKQKNPDEALKIFCSKNPSVLLATFDRKLRKSVKNNLLTIKGKRIVQV